MREWFRKRNYFLVGGSFLVILYLYLTDPNGGAMTAIFLQQLATPVIAVWFAYLARKALFDYIDMEELYVRAKESAVGSAITFAAICIVFFGLLGLFGSNAKAEGIIPTKAAIYLPTVKAEQQALWVDHPKGFVLANLIEHESCVSLTHSRCWDPSSRLKTSREEGAGLFQITRAYYPNGTIRFDALEELRNKYPKYLYELNWLNIYSRADLQIRAGILKSKDNYLQFVKYSANTDEALAFADAAYNGGTGGVNNERRACYISKGCDASRWFGHVEKYCLKSKVALYGNRSACDINRHHVKDVLIIKADKYAPFFK